MNRRLPPAKAASSDARGVAAPPDGLRETLSGLWLGVKLQPRASRNEILGPQDGELRIRVTAPPVDAAANEALVLLLAETLQVPRRSVELVRGHTSRHKTLRLHGVSVSEARTRLRAAS